MIMKVFPKKIMLLGSGELGKEVAIAAKRLGCYVISCDRYIDAPAMQIADQFEVLNMNNAYELREVIDKCNPDIIIPEIEALAVDVLKEIELTITVIQNARATAITMNRDKIRDLASTDLKIKTAKFDYIFEFDDLEKKADEIGFPLLLKPLMSSSGKGQSLVETKNDLQNAWNQAQANSRGKVKGVIIEEFINFDFEFTLLTVRKENGENIFCLPIGHLQSNGDYQCSWQPIEINESLIFEAKRMTSKILNNLNGAGLYGVEFFIKGSDVIFSELSPRPHDTGMVTLVSQNINEFELHLRAFLNLPIPYIDLIEPSATRVILSNQDYVNPIYEGLNEALEFEKTKVLIFGKPVSRKGRRMGVVLSSNSDINLARKNADEAARKIKVSSK